MELYKEYYGEIFEVFSPIGAQTDSTIALRWNKPYDYKSVSKYLVYVNSTLVLETKVTDVTLTDLAAGEAYKIYIVALKDDGKVLHTTKIIQVSSKSLSTRYDVTSYGAIGDGISINTLAIQAAIDACDVNGTVYIPSGTFVTGAIYLKSDMNLYLEEGAILRGSDDVKDFPIMNYRFEGLEEKCYASLVNTMEMKDGMKLKNISILGKGKIDANGVTLRKGETTELKGKPGRAVCLRNVENVYLYGITVKQSPAWCVHLIYCENICVNQVSIFTKCDEDGTRYYNICNGDGLTIDSSMNTYVFSSMIASQDDCISIKSGKNEEGRAVGIPTEHLRISNCQFKSGFGIAYGSEMSGGLRDILLEDCTFENTYSVASLKSPRGRGGVIEDIICRDITHYNYDEEFSDCKWFRGALLIDEFYSHDEFDLVTKEEINEGTSIIRNVIFENITLDTTAGNAIYLTGLPESPLENIKLIHIKAKGKCGFKANNVVQLHLEGVEVTSSNDEDYIMKGVTLC